MQLRTAAKYGAAGWQGGGVWCILDIICGIIFRWKVKFGREGLKKSIKKTYIYLKKTEDSPKCFYNKAAIFCK